MGNEVGRTGFHVTHEKSVKKRGAILDEMMRELKDESVDRWAQRNPSIVVGSSPVEWCNRFVSFGVGYALSWSGGSSCWVGWGVSRDLVRTSRLR